MMPDPLIPRASDPISSVDTDLKAEIVTLAAVRMLTRYRAGDGRRFHPDDTLAMIRALIDNRHPDLDLTRVDDEAAS